MYVCGWLGYACEVPKFIPHFHDLPLTLGQVPVAAVAIIYSGVSLISSGQYYCAANLSLSWHSLSLQLSRDGSGCSHSHDKIRSETSVSAMRNVCLLALAGNQKWVKVKVIIIMLIIIFLTIMYGGPADGGSQRSRQ